jgi:hypothetical protein
VKTERIAVSSVQPGKVAELGVVICGGPSLTTEQVEEIRLSRFKTFAVGVNNAYMACDWLDIVYAADWQFWTELGHEVPDGPRRVSTFDASSRDPAFKPRFDVDYLKGIPGAGFDFSPEILRLGGHSGHHAIQIAIKRGCEHIILLGLDMCAPDGRQHWFGNYEQDRLNRRENYRGYIPQLAAGAEQAKAKGIRIYNCSPISIADCFDKLSVTDALAEVASSKNPPQNKSILSRLIA